jgi:diacylglycerol kinase family enzyme
VRIAWRLFRRDFRTDASALYRNGREFRIECDPPQLYQADGEILGTTPYTVRVEPLAARLLVARRD